MVRRTRVVAPGMPHHITQRGNRRQQTFFCAEDYQAYIALMGEWCRSCMDEPSLLAAARDCEQNTVRAGLAARPWDYPGSSASPLVAGRDDSLVNAAPLRKRVGPWEDCRSLETVEAEVQRLRRSERTGRPLGSEAFTVAVERNLRRTLRRGKPGPKGSRAP